MSVFFQKSAGLFLMTTCFFSFVDCNKNPATPTTGTIQGQVTNATGDTLIAGANISTTPPTSAVSSDAHGKYSITDVSPGEYTVAASKGGYKSGGVNISVAAGRTTTANIALGENSAPEIPSLVSPLNASNDQPTTITLRWSCTDIDGDSLTYDVYMGKTSQQMYVVSTAQTGTSVTRTGLDTSSTYYWKIVAKDNREGISTTGTVWSFTTQKNPGPGTPETLSVRLGLAKPIVVKYIPAGTFQMGDSAAAGAFPGDIPVHQVMVSAFSMQETQVTQEQYVAVMGTNPAHFTGDLLRPVENVTWYDAVNFCNALSKLSGLDTVYDTTTWVADFTKKGIRLPTEAEYEYACRGGSAATFWWGVDSTGMGARAWSYYNSGNITHPVATKLANAYGLFDVTGNVWNWCHDWYGPYAADAELDPVGPASGTCRTIRGGTCLNNNIDLFRCAVRRYLSPGTVTNDGGFRVVLPR
jgi:formylglycine-generating enzyme required for sulfatase activity